MSNTFIAPGEEDPGHSLQGVAGGGVPRGLGGGPEGERLAGAGFRSFLERCPPRFVAVDEAHCISHWGHDFRPEYRQLAALKRHFPGASIHAYTATATERVRDDIIAQLGLVVSTQPMFIHSEKHWLHKRLGPERARQAYPLRWDDWWA